MILRDQRLRDGQAKPAAAFASGHQRKENLFPDFFGMPGPSSMISTRIPS